MADPERTRHARTAAPGADPQAGQNAARAEAQRGRLLGMRVSRVLDANPAALQTLIQGGFEPLANPAMRFALAHTVTLEQALRIRGLEGDEAEQLLDRLLALGVAEGL